MLILVVDGDRQEAIGEAVVDFLCTIGHEPILTPYVRAAEKIFCATKPEVLILNKTPSTEDQMASIAKEAMDKKIRTIIISTGKSTKIPCDGFIKAPFDLEILENMIHA